MNISGDAEAVKVKVKNLTQSTLRVLLYQSDIEVTADTYLTGVWRQAMLSAGSVLSALLPINLIVGAAERGADLEVETAMMDAP